MAIIQCFCQDCSHLFYDIHVACRKETKEACPVCESNKVERTIIQRKDGKPALAPCKHIIQ